MDESNREMVHMLIQQIGVVLRPLIQNSTQSYQKLATQMTRIGNFLGDPRAQVRHHFPPENPVPQREVYDEINVQQAPVVEEQPRLAQRPHVVMVRRDQDPDNVVRQVRQQENAGEDNLENIVERIMVRNGANPGLMRPNFTSPLADYVLQAELPRGWKVPKFTKFARDTKESTVEHVARYETEAGDLANDEDLKMKYFPSSLTKNAFLWFTTFPPQSIHTWTQLERLFHEQFYMGQTKISLKELASVKRKVSESVDQYLNRFRLLKARCFTQVPEHELVEMTAGGLDYSIRKKLDTQYLRDMAQLADRVRQVESMKAKKSRARKYHKKEKVPYVAAEEYYSSENEDFKNDNKINVAELKPGPPYACKLLKPSNGKNPTEAGKSEKFVTKTYTFDVSKCDEIFDLLVKDGQIVVPQGLKDPPLNQKKKRGFCKFHNFLGHKTSYCVLFRDLVQKALNEGRLQFEEKPKMQVDADPLKVEEEFYSEINDCMMIEATEGLEEEITAETFEGPDNTKKLEEIYPQAGESLEDFQEKCKVTGSEAALCPRCNAVFDKKAAERYEEAKKKTAPRFLFDSKGNPRRNSEHQSNIQSSRPRTFIPPSDTPPEKWVEEVSQKGSKRPKWKIMEMGSLLHGEVFLHLFITYVYIYLFHRKKEVDRSIIEFERGKVKK